MSGNTELMDNGGGRMRRLATYASVSVATVLIICKLAAFFYTNSVAMLSSLLDSTIDLIAALVTLYGVASALRPPDREHRFGHGKAEPLAALAQAAFIVGSSVLLSYEALSRFYNPHEIKNENFGYFVMVVAIVLSMALVFFQHLVVRRTGSMAIGADKIHYIGDVAINLAVIAALALYQWTGQVWYDPLFAILIAGGLAYNAFRIALQALNVLMDHELPDKDRDKIKAIVQAQQSVRGIHDLRTRFDGERAFIEFHLELDENMTLKIAHDISDAIMDALRKEFPDADIFIHQDPEGLMETRLDQKIARTTRG